MRAKPDPTATSPATAPAETSPTCAVAAGKLDPSHIRGSAFPATRDELVARATANGAPEATIEGLAKLPQEWFETLDEVLTAWECL